MLKAVQVNANILDPLTQVTGGEVHTDVLCRHTAWPCRVMCSPGGIIYLVKVTRTLCSPAVGRSLGVCLSKITQTPVITRDDAFRDNSFPSLVVMIKHFC